MRRALIGVHLQRLFDIANALDIDKKQNIKLISRDVSEGWRVAGKIAAAIKALSNTPAKVFAAEDYKRIDIGPKTS